MDPEISAQYGNRVRVRACGLCWHRGQLLMANHRGLTGGVFWAPPGGGLEFGERLDECLEREFMEETGLQIAMGRFLFGCEYMQKPLHAIELFFDVAIQGGSLQKGDDPELALIADVRFMSPLEITGIPPGSLHGVFGLVPSPVELKTLTGFFRI